MRWLTQFVRSGKRPVRRRPARRLRLDVERLEDRLNPAPPFAPVITLPAQDGAFVAFTNVQLETGPFSDPDQGDFHLSSDWRLFTDRFTPNELVWRFDNAKGQESRHTDLGDGVFLGSHKGFREALPDTNYRMEVRHRDNNGEVSTFSVRFFRTTPVIAGDPDVRWQAPPGFLVETVAPDFRLPVNIAFVPNPGPKPTDPLYYVTELYGAIKVVSRDGTVSTYAGGDPQSLGGPAPGQPGASLLNFNPTGAFPGSGEQGLAGIVVDPVSGDVFASLVYSQVPFSDPSPHFGRVIRLHSTDGGRTASSITTVLDTGVLSGFSVALEAQGQSHQISNLSIGPDGKLYVHNGEGFAPARSQNLDSFGGKILRVNLDGTAPDDNPFFNAADGINARDYVFALGLRNPFGGAFRANGQHFTVENGPEANDRLSLLVRGRNYTWGTGGQGLASQMTAFATYVWPATVAPVNIAFVESTKFGGSLWPAERLGNAYVTESGPTYGLGPQTNGKRITEFVLDADGNRVSGPNTLVRYIGTGRASVSGLAQGPDGLYFTDLYRDQPATFPAASPIARGANVLRVKFIGAADFTADVTASPSAPLTVNFFDRSSVPGATDYVWDFGDGTFSSERSPTHTYKEPGVYSVRLTVAGPNGAQDILKSNFIGVGQVGFKAEYFNNPSGSSIPNQIAFFTGVAPALVRIDATANVTDAGGVVRTGGPGGLVLPQVQPDDFAVRWTGFIRPRFSEQYTFRTFTDDGVRLWVNNQLIVNQWILQGGTSHTGTITLEAGIDYDIKMEYFERGGGAVAQLFWSSASQAEELVGATGRVFANNQSIALTPPANLRVTSTTADNVNLAWIDDSDNETGFRVERRLTDETAFTVVTTTGPNVATFSDTPAPGVYVYRVVAVNDFGESLISNEVTALFRVPGPPTNLRVTSFCSSEIELSWNASAGAVGYRIERAAGGGPFEEVGVVAGTSFADGGLSQGVYSYRVRAFNFNGSSPYSAVLTFRLQPPDPVEIDRTAGFADASGLTRNGSANFVVFSGQTVARLTGNATGQAGSFFTSTRVGITNFTTTFSFQIRNGTTPPADGMAFVIQGIGPTALGPSGGGLGYGPDSPGGPPGILNSLAIKFDIFNNAGEGVNSTGLFTNGRSPTVPTQPGDRTINLDGTGIDLRSQRVFQVTMSYNGATLQVTIRDTVSGATATQTYEVNIATLVGGETAFVGFTGGTGGLTAFHEVLGWRFQSQPGAPGAPSNLQATAATNSEVLLAWRCNSTDESGFVVERSADGVTFSPIATLPSTRSFRDTGLAAGVYLYRVRAFNDAGTSGPSNVVAVGVGPVTTSHAGGFFDNSDLRANGSARFTATSDGTFVARLTSNENFQAGSFYTSERVGVGAFTTTFSFRSHGGTTVPADGLTFVIHNDPRGAAALGAAGVGLGYQGVGRSVAVKFDFFQNGSDPSDNTTGLFQNGQLPVGGINLNGTGIDLRTDHVFRVTLAYNGATLFVTITDRDTGASATQSYAVDIRSVVDGSTAYVGFTGGTGGLNAIQDVLTWTFSVLPARPSVPANLRATAAFTSRIDLAWNAALGADGYRLERSRNGGGFSQIAELPAGVTSHIDADLPVGTYVYRVRAFSKAGDSPFSNTVPVRLGIVDHRAGFADNSDLTRNGSAQFVGTVARVTQNVNGQAGTVFTNARVGIGAFNNVFTYQLGPRTNPPADGATFIIQGNSPNALGAAGGGLGYTGIGNSIAVKLDFFKNGTSSTGLYINGQEPGTFQFNGAPQIDLVPSGIDFRNGNRFQIQLSYNGTTLTQTISDLTVPRTFTTSWTIDIRNIVGSGTAFVGFGGGTGGLNAEQNVQTWIYTPQNAAPTAPGNLRVTTAGAQATLRWTAASGADSYRIERADNGSGFQEIAVVPATATTFDDPEVLPAGPHAYRVQAVNFVGSSAFSNTSSVTVGTATFDRSSGFADTSGLTRNGSAVFFRPNAEAVGILAGHQDIGAVAAAGSATFASGTYTVRASGSDIWDNNDQFHFVYRPLVGNGEIIARVVTLGDTDFWSKAGVMLRETLLPQSRNVFMMNAHPNADSEAGFQWRIDPNGGTSDSRSGFGTRPRPVWVRLVRNGNQFSGFSRLSPTDSWVQQGPTVTINMGPIVYAGLALTAHNNSGVINTSTFDNVSLIGTTTDIPPTSARLTTGANGQAGSIFTNTQLGIAAFTTSFNFRVTPGTTAQLADGFTFALQTNSPTALGQFGAGLGYGQENPGAPLGITNSVAVKFDFFKNNVSSVGVYTNGQLPGTTQFDGAPQAVVSPLIEFRSGREFRVDIAYDGATLTGTITDVLNPVATVTASVAIDIRSFVGSDTAHVGFTGGTGGLNAIQDILNFRFESL